MTDHIQTEWTRAKKAEIDSALIGVELRLQDLRVLLEEIKTPQPWPSLREQQ
jgi:hypothetical protein